MYSRTEPRSPLRGGAAQRAAAKARLAPLLAWLAAAIGLAFIGLFLVQAGLFAALMPRETVLPVAVEKPEQITSHHSTLTGFDRERQPYEVTAVRGFQDQERPELVHLETVRGKFLKTTGQSYELEADKALYDTGKRELGLDGNVILRQAGRFTARMAKAHVVVADKKLTSEAAVAVEFDGGTITANGLQISDDGNNILFLNGVKSRFAW